MKKLYEALAEDKHCEEKIQKFENGEYMYEQLFSDHHEYAFAFMHVSELRALVRLQQLLSCNKAKKAPVSKEGSSIAAVDNK